MSLLTQRIKWLTFARIASIIISILTAVLIPKLLGESSFSRYSYYVALISIFFQFTGFGVEQSIQRFTYQYRSENNPGKIKNLFLFGLKVEGVSILLEITFLGILFLIDPRLTDKSILILILVIVSILMKTISQYAYLTELGFEKFKLAFINSAPAEAIVLISVLVGFFYGNFIGAILGYTIASTILAIIGLTLVLKTLKDKKISSSNSNLINRKKIIGYGIPLYFGNNLSKITPPVATFFIAVLFGKSTPEVGMFAIAIGAVTAASHFLTTLNTSTYPLLVNSYQKNNVDEMKLIIEKLIKFGLIFALISYATILSLSTSIFDYILPNYTNATFLMKIIGITLIINAIERPYSQLTQTNYKTRINLEKGVIYFFSYVLLFPIAIFFFRDTGASTAFLLLTIITATYSIIRIKKSTNLKINIKKLIPTFITSMILFIPVFLHRKEVSFIICTFIWLYLTWNKVLDDWDRSQIIKLIKTIHPKKILKIS